jgi:ABC-2 type transport system ATP-binding protein
VAAHDVDDAAYSFVISDSSGTPIMGTDSEQKKKACGGLREGEGVYVQWSVPNIFRDGVHTVEISITDRQGLTIYDQWKEAATFTVVKEEKTPYLVTPDTSFSFARAGGYAPLDEPPSQPAEPTSTWTSGPPGAGA